jgi:hypothetical protein
MRPHRRRSRALHDPPQTDRAHAVVAWRFWSVDGADGEVRLRSPYRDTVWEVEEPVIARCLGPQLRLGPAGHRHQAPGPDCQCGVYGGTYRDLRTFLNGNLVRLERSPVLGRVLLWGSVLTEGPAFRASHAYPERLFVPTFVRGAFRVADELEAYGVPVTILDARDTFSALHPTSTAPLPDKTL